MIEGNSDMLASALAEGAKHNATVRKFISSGGNTWAIQLASVGVTMGMQTMQLMKDPELRKEAAGDHPGAPEGRYEDEGHRGPGACP